MVSWQAHPTRVVGLRFDPAGRLLVTVPAGPSDAAPAPVTVWDAAGGRVRDFTADGGHGATFTAAAFGPAGDRLFVAGWGVTGGRRLALRGWDVGTGRLLAGTRLGYDTHDLVALPDGGLLTAAGANVYRHPPGLTAAPTKLSGPPRKKLPRAYRVAVSPDGTRLGGVGAARAIVWEAATGRPLAARDHPKSPQHGPGAFRPGSSVLAVGHGTVVDLWDFASGQVVTLVGHKRPVWAVGFGPGGEAVYTAASDGTVREWDAETGTSRRALDFGTGKLYAAAVAPDGLTLAVGGDDGRVTVVDLG